jgi:hypothetical protein
LQLVGRRQVMVPGDVEVERRNEAAEGEAETLRGLGLG